MLFSFVLPAYKAKYLAASIESILSQTYKEFELIIVNDASSEDLDSIVHSFQDIRISYYKNEQNIGGKDLVKQWNHCITYAKGDYIILASDDDLYTPNFLSTFLPLIKKYPKVNVFRARSLEIDSNGNICNTDSYYKEYIDTNEFRYLWFIGIKGGIANYIFNRNKLLSIGGFVNFPLAWGSDEATILQMADNGIVTTNDYLFKFRWSGINISSNNNGDFQIKKLKARIYFCRWREKYIKINTKTPLDNYYQKYIYKTNHWYIYNSLKIIIDQMNFFTFIHSLRTIITCNILNNSQKSKLISNYLTTRPFKYIHSLVSNIFK